MNKFDRVIDGKTITEWAEHYQIKPQAVLNRLLVRGSIHGDSRYTNWSKYAKKTYEELALEYNTTVQIVINRHRWYGDKWKKGLKKG